MLSSGPSSVSQIQWFARIIVLALFVGAMMFFAIAVWLVASDRVGGEFAGEWLITGIALAFAGMMLVSRMIVPPIVVQSNVKRLAHDAPDEMTLQRRLAEIYLQRTIFNVAPVEGAIFFVLVSYILEQQPLSLAVALLMAITILLEFPRGNHVAAWFDSRRQEIEQFRQLSS